MNVLGVIMMNSKQILVALALIVLLVGHVQAQEEK
jgi:hypothetical protein